MEVYMNINWILKTGYLTSDDFFKDVIDFIVKESASKRGYILFLSSDSNSIEHSVWSSDFAESRFASDTCIDVSLFSETLTDEYLVTNHPGYIKHSSNHMSLNKLPRKYRQLRDHCSISVVQNNRAVAIVGLENESIVVNELLLNELHNWLHEVWTELRNKAYEIEQANYYCKKKFESSSPYKILVDMLEAISKALAVHDEYTSSHQKNVSLICDLIATELSMDEHAKKGLIIGALVHDIGKVAVPSQILNKTGRLSPAERLLLQYHCEVGAQIFNNVSLPWTIVDMISQHHERLDGSGYPRGLKGNEIVLEARIIAVADTFDAIASDRPYRKALGSSKAIEVLKSGRDSLYDGNAVDALLRCYEIDQTLGGKYNQLP